MRASRLLGCLLIIAGLWAAYRPGAAKAAGIDCSKARSPAEQAICASPSLLALDRAVADAYADHLQRQPEPAGQARQELIAWLEQRDAACNVAAAALERCLTRELTARLAALAPPATLAQVPPHEPTVPSLANPPQAAATLDAASLPAAAEADTLLHVTSPGRFTIAAHSGSGAALQLVDMLSGPSNLAGSAGVQDGRLDLLLDVGSYKLRVFSAKGASGTVALAVTAFTDTAPPRALPAPGTTLDTDLADGKQRGFWLYVPPNGAVRIEAAGRALADLRLWRDGRELTDLEPAATMPEPVPGHPLTDLRLVGRVEPGTYLAVAYGGPAARWTDNDTAQPFHLRAGASDALAEGWAFGTVGPFGSEVFTLPASTQRVRLDLPAPAPASLAAGDAAVTIARNSREAAATLAVPDSKPQVIELGAGAGQPYKLQALAIPDSQDIIRPGTYWVSAVTAGAGGDEVPPSALLERTEPGGKPPRIVAASEPVLSPTVGWRGQFNLRGPTTMLFQTAAGGAVQVRTAGVAARTGRGRELDLPADYYTLDVAPVGNTQGVVDLVIGPPGANPAATPPLPPNPVLPLGIQTVAPGQTLSLLATQAPGVSVGLSARPVPVALAEGPLSVTMAAGSTLNVPVALAPGGSLAVTEGGGGPVPATMQGGSVMLPAADRARTLVLAWRRAVAPPADIPAPPPLASMSGLQAGHPAFFDLAANQQRSFALTVPEGGVYRVETLGRLHTTGRLSTPFIPSLGSADGNGAGLNMLIQSVLRAGRYRVTVTALESSGHLAISAAPAPLLTGTTLRPGGSVRATLPPGTGAAFPVEVGAEAERYHLDVLSLGRSWTGRVEDADGWPLARPGPLDGVDLPLPPGRYRLVVEADTVARQVVARLRPVVAAAEIAGHGPHPLAFESPAHAVWREPDGRDQPRTPDAWTFRLQGPADVTVSLSAGMAGELHQEGTPEPVARVTGQTRATLQAGAYRLDATSLGRNDRLAYTVLLTSRSLQPGVARTVTLPATLPFAIAEPRVVSLTSFGSVPAKGVLRQADGRVIARMGPRADDWNIAASRPLPAGSYTLDLAAAVPPAANATSPNQPADSASNDASDADATDDQRAQTAATQTASSHPAAPQSDDAGDSADTPPDTAPAPKTEIRLALPPALEPQPAPPSLTPLAGRGVHVLTLPQPPAGSLAIAQARSDAAIVLALERREAAGWRPVALSQGPYPIVASPADVDPAPWRVEAWTVDGGPEPIQLAAQAVEAAAQAPGPVSWTALDDGLAVTRVRLPEPGIAALSGAPDSVLAGGWAGHALAPIENGLVLPEGAELWLLAREAAALDVAPASIPVGQSVAVSLPAGLAAPLPASRPAEGHVALWQAESGFGLPGLGGAMAVAAGSTLAPAAAGATLRNATGEDALRVRLTRVEPVLLPPQPLGSALQTVVPPGSALPLSLPPGGKRLRVDLAPGLAVMAGGRAVVWTGSSPASRSLAADWTDLMLVNIGAAPAPASLSWQPAPPAPALHAGRVVKRFFGADGSFELAADGAPGTRLLAAGTATLTAITADGRVLQGRAIPLSGPARVVVDAKAGAMAVWAEADGVSPWPTVDAQPTQLPARLALSGPAMALSLHPEAAMLLHARTTAPVLLGLVQSGRAEPPELFAAGAEFNRMVAAGPAELRLYSPQDGPLSGSLDLTAEPVTSIAEGLGPPVAVAPGGAAVFGFSLAQAATVGVGVRATPDRAVVRLLDAAGQTLGSGVAQLRALPAGHYAIEARVPPDAPTTVLRPAIIGITPRGDGPPPDVVQRYLELAGMKPQGKAP